MSSVLRAAALLAAGQLRVAPSVVAAVTTAGPVLVAGGRGRARGVHAELWTSAAR
jgi:hypothetical protein